MSYDNSAVYLDNAATTPLDPAILEVMLPYLTREQGNPSSVHGPGVAARRAVEGAREQVFAALGSRLTELVFTSGGTEANNLALFGYARLRKGDQLVISSVEHPSVHRAAESVSNLLGIPCRQVRVDSAGRLDLNHLGDLLTEKTSVVSLIHGQNEYGSVQPVLEAAAIVRERAPRAHLHLDTVQSFGKISVEPLAAVADSLSLSAHKLHGPKGAGALALFSRSRPVPRLEGRGQENGRRAGTANGAGAVGFGMAAARAARNLAANGPRLALMNEQVLSCLEQLPDTRLLGSRSHRLPTIAAALLGGVPGEVLQHHLEQRGVVIGTGSACHAGRNRISPTYKALGLDLEQARSVIRISLSYQTSAEDLDRLLTELPAALSEVRELIR
ncbi:MAG: cysteine desulfurase family protein [Planctomycetota bacterium]